MPGFDELVSHRPRHVGVIYRCDACNAPIFLRYPVKMFGSNRLELGAQFSEVERASEKFSYTYLPDGSLNTRLYPDATLTTYSYFADGSLASVASGGVNRVQIQ